MNGIKLELRLKREVETRVDINKERQKVLDSFGPIDPRTNLDMSRKLRYPNTGLWLIESPEFKDWLCTDKARLWLYGIPGAGKTILASLVIDEVLAKSKPSIAAAYFYCDYKDIMTQEPCRILSCIVQQLAKQDEQSYTKVQKFYESHAQGRKHNIEYDPQDLCDLIANIATNYDCTMIVVDALDECGEKSSTATEFLASLGRKEGDVNIKTLFLSRDEFDIRECLNDYSTISIAARSSDLRLYVDAEIEIRTRKKKLNIKTSELKEYVRNRLVDGAEGIQMDYLCELPNDAARRKALKDLPRGLKPTYERILRNINTSNDEVKKLVQKTLRWLTVRPSLSVRQLCEAVSVDLGDGCRNTEAVPDEREILRHCSSLVRMSVNKDQIEFAHFSVEEFLQQIDDVTDVGFAAFKIHTNHIERELTKLSLTYLNFEDFGHSRSATEESAQSLLDQFPFRRYVVENWCHVGESADWDDPELFGLATKLFHPSKPNNLISWILDLFGNFLEGSDHDHDHDAWITLNQGIKEATALHYAAMEGLHKVCYWLIEKGCDVNRKSRFGTPLHCALLSRDVMLVSSLSGHFEDETFYIGRGEDTRTIAVLLEARADPNILYYGCSDTLSPLQIAVVTDWSWDASRQLLQNGAIVDDSVVNFVTNSSEEGWSHSERSSILEHAVDATLKGQTRAQALQHALNFGMPASTWLLPPMQSRSKAEHSDLDRRNEMNLRTAATRGQLEACVRLLDDCRVDVHASEEDTLLTPLLLASMTDQLEVIKVLLERGASLEKTDHLGKTALHHCVKAEGHRCLSYLLGQGMSTAAKDNANLTVWHIAALDGNAEALGILLSHAASRKSFDQSEFDRDALISYVSQSGSAHATKLLIDAGCNAFAADPHGCTALHHAAKAGSQELVSFLISHGLEANATTDDGSSTIHYAMMAMSPSLGEVLDILLDHGVDPFTRRRDGSTPVKIFFDLDPPDTIPVIEVLRSLASLPAAFQVDQEGLTQALHYLCKANPSRLATWGMAAFRLLLDSGASLMSKDQCGKTALRALSDEWRNKCSELERWIRNDDRVKWTHNSHWVLLTDMMAAAIDRISLNGPMHEICAEPALLRWAIETSDAQLAFKLLEHSPNVDEHIDDDEEMSPIKVACRVGCSRTLFKELLARSKASSDKALGSCLLREACTKGGVYNLEVLSELLEVGFDHHEPSADGHTALHVAAGTGSIDMIRLLLSYGSNANATGFCGWNAANYAINHARGPDVLRVFKNTDMSWNAKCDLVYMQFWYRNVSVLHHAALAPNKGVLQYLLEEDLVQDINEVSDRNETALFLAALYGLPGNVSLLLSNGADPTIMASPTTASVTSIIKRWSPMHIAARWGHEKVIEEFIKYGCNLDLQNSQGLTCEIIALRYGHEDLADVLGKHIREQRQPEDSSQMSRAQHSSVRASWLLRLAIEKGDLELCQTVISGGVSLDTGYHDCDDCTPFFYSLWRDQLSIARLLASSGASPVGTICRHANPFGFSAFHVAAAENDVELLKILLERHPEQYHQLGHSVLEAILHRAENCVRLLLVDAEEHAQPLSNLLVGTLLDTSLCGFELWDATPLLIALRTQNGQLAKLLLQSGCLVNLADSSYTTPLHVVASQGPTELLQILLEFGANPQAQNDMLSTPTMLAATQGSIPSVKALVAGGANLYMRDSSGDTALECAATAGNIGLLLYLMASMKWSNTIKENKHGESFIVSAFWGGQMELPVLLNMVPSPEYYTDAYSNILTAAVGNRDITTRVVRMILKRIPLESRPEFLASKTRYFGTPLYTACTRTTAPLQDSIITLLLDAGADLETDGGDYGTALMGACTAGRLAAVKPLVRKGAKMVYSKDGETFSALRCAKFFPEVVQWLLVGKHTEGPRLLTRGGGI